MESPITPYAVGVLTPGGARVTVSEATNRAETTGVTLVRLLGPVQVVTPDGTMLGLPSATQRRLVAALALDARRPIGSERLAADLRMSPGSLRTSVSRLRKLLGSEVLRTDAVGYRLEADVDSELFDRALLRVGPAADRLAQLERALQWWHGPAIEEFRGELWARSESVRLTELYAAAVEEHAAELMTRGRWPEAIAALKRHMAGYPRRDHARGLLMQALAGSGRRAEAFAVYWAGADLPSASRRWATPSTGPTSQRRARPGDRGTADRS
jgi:DNA-binding SARP family transcriptional activator